MLQLVTVIVACAAIASGFEVGVARRGPVEYLNPALHTGYHHEVIRSSPLVEVEHVRRPVVEVEQVRRPVVEVEQVRRPIVEVEQVRRPVYEVEQVRRPSVVHVEQVRRPVVEVEQFRRPVVEVEQFRRPVVEVEQFRRPVIEVEQVRRSAPVRQFVEEVRRPSVVHVEQVRRPVVTSRVEVEQVRRPAVETVTAVEVEQVRRPVVEVVEQVRPRPARIVELLLPEPEIEVVAPARPYSSSILSADEHLNYMLGKLNFVIPSPEQRGFVALILALTGAAKGVARGLDYDSAYAAEVKIFELGWQSPEAARDLLTPYYKQADAEINTMRRLISDVCNIRNEGSCWCDEQIEQTVRNNPQYQRFADLVIEVGTLKYLSEEHLTEWSRVIEEHREEEYLARARYSLKNYVLQTARVINILGSDY